jgi:hypothetical protein
MGVSLMAISRWIEKSSKRYPELIIPAYMAPIAMSSQKLAKE